MYGLFRRAGCRAFCGDVASGLGVDAVEDLTGALVSGRGFNSGDDIIVVEVFGMEEIDVRTALVTLGGAVAAIVTVTAILFLGSPCLLFGNAVDLLLGVLLQVSVPSPSYPVRDRWRDPI